MVIVDLLKLGAELHAHSQLSVRLERIVVLDRAEDLITVDLLAALVDEGVADLTDEYEQASWGVVMLRVSPDKQDGVHDGHEVLGDLG